MQKDKNTPNKPRYGLNKDYHPSEQPEGTVRFALNAVKEDYTGNMATYQSEPANELCLELPDGYKVIGSIYLNDGDKVIFATNNTTSKIILLDNECNSSELVSTDCLGFSTTNNIVGEYRVRKGCNRTIYWSDFLNNDRWLDLDDLDSFKDASGNWDCNLFKLTPGFVLPKVSVSSVSNSGGQLAPGSYAFGVEIIDSSFNVVDKSLLTPYINIYDDDTTKSYEDIFGSFPGSYLSEQGGINTTSKSVNLILSDLDTSFSYVRLIIVAKISGNGIEQAFRSERYIPITGPTIRETFRSLTDFILDDVNSLRVPKIKYTASKTIEQVQGRLVRGNVFEKNRDYSGYQRAVNDIVTQWRSKAVNPKDIRDQNSSKNPIYSLDGVTFIGDEVQSFGIVYVYEDGSLSPAFHIPGRAANETDKDTLTIVDGPTAGNNVNIQDVAHLGLSVGQTIERWEFYNTSTGVGLGDLAYFESNNNYPDIVDGDGEFIYGDLANTPIRHHKFPDRKRIPIQFNNSSGETRVNVFGVQFSNITYPDADIVGHFFVTGIPEAGDKVVVDTGIIIGSTPGGEYFTEDSSIALPHAGRFLNLSFENVYGIRSPKTFTKLDNDSDYIRPLYVWDTALAGPTGSSDRREYNSGDIVGRGDYYKYSSISQSDTDYRNIVSQFNIFSNSEYDGIFGKPVENRSYSNDISAVELEDLMLDTESFATVSMQRIVDPYNDLFSISYKPITEILTLTDSQITYRGGGFIVDFSYADLWRIRANDNSFIEELFENLDEFSFDINHYRGIWLETDINYSLIARGTDCNSKFVYPNSITEYGIRRLATYDGSNWVLRPSICPEYYNYNIDYTPTNSNTDFLPIPITFDYANQCLNKKPNRLIFSPKSFDEEISDFYRLNFVDDYIDLPAHRGEINGIKYKNNKLYVHTDQSTFILQPNPQFLATDQGSAYLNTGDFLSIPPYEIMQSDTGYGGMTNKLGNCNSEGGYTWIDGKRGKVINLVSQLEEVNRNGLLQWFKEYGDLELNSFVKKETGSNYVLNDSISDDYGIGFSITYDPRFERVIITKKDYIPNSAKFRGVVEDYELNPTAIENGYLYFDKNLNRFITRSGNTVTPVTLTNSLFFYQNSWTISYSYKEKSFISYHSYLPDILFSDELYFYNAEDNKIYRHLHKEKYGEFNGKLYPFVIEYVANDYNTDTLSAIHYYANFEKAGVYSTSNYSKLIAYNSNQSTGELTLVNIDEINNPYSSISLPASQKSVITYDDNSKISNLWDNAIDNKVTSNDPADIATYLTDYGYIDSVPVNIDFTKSAYEAGELRDKYIRIRLIYLPDHNDEKVSHRISNTLELQSIR